VPEWILGGTGVMLNSIETITNKDKFLHYFQERSGLSKSEIWEIFLHFENMYTGKPHKVYFEQILKVLDTKSDRCLMIGNDLDNLLRRLALPRKIKGKVFLNYIFLNR
jgi:hypothetical protein